MSRSRRKNPICGHTTAKSDKVDKQRASRRTRRINSFRLKITEALEFVPLSSIAVNGSGDYMFAKDGKQRIKPNDEFYKIVFRK